MKLQPRRLVGRRPGVFVCAAIAAACVALPSGAGAASTGTCSGGSVGAGTYSSLTITGFCTLDAGSVTVQNNLTVQPGAGLLAAFGGSDLTVGGNVDVKKNAALVMGCEPEAFICFNDPDQNIGTMATDDSVAGSLTGEGALAMLLHHDAIGGSLVLAGGGGGVNCDPQDLLEGSPAYATAEDVQIGGNATIAGWRTCWLGFFRNDVKGNVTYVNNITADPDGNEVQTNTIGGNLDCSANAPAPQMGDSGGSPNAVGGHETGQCKGL